MWVSDDAWIDQHSYVAAIVVAYLCFTYLDMRAKLVVTDLSGRSSTRQDLRRWLLTAYMQMSDAAVAGGGNETVWFSFGQVEVGRYTCRQ
jgi:hypothetical protein